MKTKLIRDKTPPKQPIFPPISPKETYIAIGSVILTLFLALYLFLYVDILKNCGCYSVDIFLNAHSESDDNGWFD